MLDFLLLLIALFAAGLGSFFATVLVTRFVRCLNDEERMAAWIDRLTEDQARWMEVEQERRAEERAFPDDLSKPLAYYGLGTLTRRWLHTREYNLACAMWAWQRRMFPKPCIHEQVAQDEHLWTDRD